MHNTRTFTARIDLWACSERWSDGITTAKGTGALEEFGRVLESYGMGVSIRREGQYATIKIDHMQPWEAKQARTRNAGRPRKLTPWPSRMGETDDERLAWAESHTLDELQAALGCSRRTAQRRLAELRKIVGK